CLFELRVPLDKFFRAASRKAHGEAAVFVVALNANDRSNAKARMTNLSPQHRICIATALCSGTPAGILTCLAPRRCLGMLGPSVPGSFQHKRGAVPLRFLYLHPWPDCGGKCLLPCRLGTRDRIPGPWCCAR